MFTFTAIVVCVFLYSLFLQNELFYVLLKERNSLRTIILRFTGENTLHFCLQRIYKLLGEVCRKNAQCKKKYFKTSVRVMQQSSEQCLGFKNSDSMTQEKWISLFRNTLLYIRLSSLSFSFLSCFPAFCTQIFRWLTSNKH